MVHCWAVCVFVCNMSVWWIQCERLDVCVRERKGRRVCVLYTVLLLLYGLYWPFWLPGEALQLYYCC